MHLLSNFSVLNTYYCSVNVGPKNILFLPHFWWPEWGLNKYIAKNRGIPSGFTKIMQVPHGIWPSLYENHLPFPVLICGVLL